MCAGKSAKAEMHDTGPQRRSVDVWPLHRLRQIG
jgi:hypothetical protein